MKVWITKKLTQTNNIEFLNKVKGVNKTEQIEWALQASLEVQNTIRLRGGDDGIRL